jgi:hypothetical protein
MAMDGFTLVSVMYIGQEVGGIECELLEDLHMAKVG